VARCYALPSYSSWDYEPYRSIVIDSGSAVIKVYIEGVLSRSAARFSEKSSCRLVLPEMTHPVQSFPRASDALELGWTAFSPWA
jgi:hypothetical protein